MILLEKLSFSHTEGKENQIAREDIDAVDICTPNDMHAEIAIAAAKAGKMILCEKPLARTVAEAKGMLEAVEAAGVKNTVWYNYRRVPAVTLAKNIVESGKLGKIFHYRANFLQDWTINPDLPQGGDGTWRLDVESAGSGVTGDIEAGKTMLGYPAVEAREALKQWDILKRLVRDSGK